MVPTGWHETDGEYTDSIHWKKKKEKKRKKKRKQGKEKKRMIPNRRAGVGKMVLLTLARQRENRKIVSTSVCPREYPSRYQCFKISKWISFIWSLDALQRAASALGSGLGEPRHKPFKNPSLVPQSPICPWTWALLVFKVRCFGGLSLRHWILKVRVTYVGYEPFTPFGEALGFEFPRDYGLLYWGWSLWWDCVSPFSTH